ncbi:DUF397 domain-containing protein [Pseudonocardia sp. RS010]|uniref:DUF397 domain-containing protein n=1 Tax=Pseudonocardia sp. RS010 TaxID=3385979 RepID=UPI00399FA57F
MTTQHQPGTADHIADVQRADPELGGLVWRHSTFSQGSDQTCRDVAFTPGQVVVRDSKDPEGPVLRFTAREWEVFLLGVRNNEFDLPLRRTPRP